MLTIDGIEGLRAHLGQELGVSDWRVISQPDVDVFAAVTGDEQWIHVDVERARDSRFGGTIVHGYYVLSLGSALQADIVSFTGFDLGLNYGLERVRFPAPLRVGSRVRLRVKLVAIDDVRGGARATFERTFEQEGSTRPVCVAQTLAQFMVGATSQVIA